MDVKWQLPQGLRRGPAALSGAEPADRRRPHELCLRARLCGARPAEGARRTRAAPSRSAPRRAGSPAPTSICVPEQGELVARPAGRRRDAQSRPVRRLAARASAAAGDASGILPRPGGKLRVAIPLPASVAVGKPYLFPITDNVVDYEAQQDFRRTGDWLVAELKATGAPPRQFAGVLALGDGRGLEFHAVPGIGARRRVGARRPRREGAAGGGARRDLRRHPAQPDAVRVPDPGAEGAASGARRRRTEPSRAVRRLGLCRGSGDRHGRARRRLAGDPRGRERGRLGVPAAGPAHDHPPAAARGRDHRQPASACSSCRCSGGGARPAGGFGTGALAAFVATPCAGPFLGAALGTALLLPPAGSVLVFAALGLGLAIAVPARLLRSRAPDPASEAGPVDEAAAALPRHPDGGERGRRAVAALPPGGAAWAGGRADRAGGARPRCLIWYGFAQRRDARDGWVILPLVDRGGRSGDVAGAAADGRRRRRPLPAPSRGARRAPRATSSRASRCSSISPPTGA